MPPKTAKKPLLELPPAPDSKSFKPLSGSGSKYSKKDVLKLFETFKSLDGNSDGEVNAVDIVNGQKYTDLKLPMSYLEFIRSLDINHDGVLTFDEVLRKYYPYARSKELEIMFRWAIPEVLEKVQAPTFTPSDEVLEELKVMFNLYDKNRNGVLEWKEVQQLAEAAGYDPEEILALFNQADADHNKVISFEEFVDLMKISYI